MHRHRRTSVIVRRVAVRAALALVAGIMGFAPSGLAQTTPVTLEQFPGLHQEVLQANGDLFQIAEPLQYDPITGIAVFYVTVNAADEDVSGEYVFAGDSYSILCFARELVWLRTRRTEAIELGEEGIKSAAGRVVEMVTDLVSLIWHLIRNIDEIAPGEMKDKFVDGFQGFKKAAGEYYEKWRAGDVDPLDDAYELLRALVAEQAIAVARRENVDFFEVRTATASDAIWNLGIARFTGSSTGDLLTLFMPFVAAKHGLSGGRAATELGELASHFASKPPARRGLSTLARYESALGSQAGTSVRLARISAFAAAESRVDYQLVFRSLLDPAKRTMSNSWGMTTRMNKLVYWLQQVEQRGDDVGEVLWNAIDDLPSRGTHPETGKMFDTAGEVENILEQYRKAKELGVFDDVENLSKLRRGQNPVLKAGSDAEELVEWDHILPVSRVPELSHSPINLQITTRTQNRSKGKQLNAESLKKMDELLERGLITPEKYDDLARSVAREFETSP